MKILNFHPFFVALNIADAGFYADVRPNIRTLTRTQAVELRNEGQGAGTFLVEAIHSILMAGHRFVTLSKLAQSIRQQTADSSLEIRDPRETRRASSATT